jgi:hypothetical protein
LTEKIIIFPLLVLLQVGKCCSVQSLKDKTSEANKQTVLVSKHLSFCLPNNLFPMSVGRKPGNGPRKKENGNRDVSPQNK